MNEYPKMLYKSPGVHTWEGNTYDFKTAKDLEEELSLIQEGWTVTSEQAVNKSKLKTEKVSKQEADPKKDGDKENPTKKRGRKKKALK